MYPLVSFFKKKWLVLISLLISILFIIYNYKINVEGFDAMGYVYNVPPAWFRKPEYDVKEWLVTTYPDMVQPSCLPYSLESKYNQDMGMMNYWSQAYQFWRF
jgi:hypothetical protein